MSLKIFKWYQKQNEGLKVWDSYGMVTSKQTKQHLFWYTDYFQKLDLDIILMKIGSQ
jgi:predicted GTPase